MKTQNWIAVDSSNILAIRYAPEEKTLSIRFKSQGAFDHYDYRDVPASLFESMRAAESKGKFFNQYVKGIFEFRKHIAKIG